MNEASKMINEFATDHRLCIIKLEHENVIGEFFKDESGCYTAVMFRSIICPKFIDETNKQFGENRENGLSGFCAEVVDSISDGDDVMVSFDDECSDYHRVYEVVAFGKNCYVNKQND